MLRWTNRILLIITIITNIVFAVDKNDLKYEADTGIPFFYYDVISYPIETRDSVRMEILIKVPFDVIQFVKKGNSFVGKYEISVLLLNEDDVQTASKIWTQEIRTESFEETNSQEHFDVNRLSFNVIPGKYLLTIGIMDLDTRKSSYRKKKIDIGDFYKDPITLSKINIIEKVIKSPDGIIEHIPSVMSSVSDVKPEFSIDFDVLSDGGKGSIKYSIFNIENKLILNNFFKRTFKKGISHETISISKQKLGFRKYRLKVTVQINENITTKERVFQLRWLGMSGFIDNLDDAIRQMRYIASPKVLKSMRKGSQKAKKEKFMKFWEKKDPTPNTKENELMNEYYKRVNYSNQHFSGFQPGWRSDMGMIFILFGPPSDIERHPFDIHTKPYEIWYYYEINRTFVFLDESGFGEYRLISPTYDILGRY